MGRYTAFVDGVDVGNMAELTMTGGVIVERDEDYMGKGFWITEIEIGLNEYRVIDAYVNLENERLDWLGIEQDMGVTKDELDRERLAYLVYRYERIGDRLGLDISTFMNRSKLSRYMESVGIGGFV